MTLTWKDGATTLLVIGTCGLYYAMIQGINLPIISGYRGAIAVLAIVGIAMCAFGARPTSGAGMNLFTGAASVLGVAALILIIYGLIAGTKLALTLLTATMVLLWIISTAHHMVGN